MNNNSLEREPEAEASIIDISARRGVSGARRRPDLGQVAGGEPRSGPGRTSGMVLLGSPLPDLGQRLTKDDVRALFRLRKIIQTDLAVRSSPLLHPGELDRIERTADLMVSPKTDNTTAHHMHSLFIGGLLRPAASHVELSTLMALSNRLDAHFGIEMARLGIHPTDLPYRRDDCYGLLEVFRNTDPQRAAAAMTRHTERGEQMALSLLADHPPQDPAESTPPRLAVVR